MQINVHHIEAHIARTTSAQHRVQVGTIVVHQTTHIVNKFRNLRNTGLKKPQRIGVGHHHGGDLCTLLSNDTLQVVEVHCAIGK